MSDFRGAPHIAKARERDNGGQSKAAREARAKAEQYERDLATLADVERFEYGDAAYGDYPNGVLGHDDIIVIASYLLDKNATFRRILGLRFPYIFVDEAQDTAEAIVRGLNLACEGEGLPIVGYFGDPWQQIYDQAGEDFAPPKAGTTITKVENFRCSRSVIRLLNGFRTDVEQKPAGKNRDVEGSVVFRFVKAEAPEEPRNRYSEAQTGRALAQLDRAMLEWGWTDDDDVVKLFLVRQMIARRMGFAELNRMFSGQFASTRAQDSFERGEHILVLPLTSTIWPLVESYRSGDNRRTIDLLRQQSPAFAVDGSNASKSLRSMIELSQEVISELNTLWEAASIGEILRFAAEKQLIPVGERLEANLVRDPRSEVYDADLHELDKGDWLADAFFAMTTREIPAYASFVSKNTAFSTQHGVKGEEYPKVLVVYDDVEAGWNNYNFGKLFTPRISGGPTEKQEARGRKLAYVSFSRALEDLRVLFFTSDPEAARAELIARGLLTEGQVEIVA